MSEWRRLSIGDLLRFHRGVSWTSEQERKTPEPGNVPVLRIPNIRERLDTSDLIWLSGVPPDTVRRCAAAKDWSVMIGSNGNPSRVGNCVFIAESTDFLYASFLVGVQSVRHDIIAPEYVFRVLSGPDVQRKIADDVQGSTGLSNISLSRLAKLLVDVPSSAEQSAICTILRTIDSAIDQTEALIAKSQQIKAGLMHDLFTRGLTAEGKLRPPREEAPDLYKQSPLGWIPKEWGVGRISDCGSVKLGRQRSPLHQTGRWTTPYLRVANVFEGFIDFSDVLRMDFTPDERMAFSLEPGDILLNEGQSLELVGRSAVYRGLKGEYCFQNTLIRFRAHPQHVADFHQCLFVQYLYMGRFQTVAKQTTSVAHLGADRFARMACPLVPFDEQLRIATAARLLQDRIAIHLDRAAKLRSLKSALMHDLLTGRVRVPVSPGEP